jgi:hypothetical protein
MRNGQYHPPLMRAMPRRDPANCHVDLVYVLAIAVAASVGATVRLPVSGAGACVGVAVAPLA